MFSGVGKFKATAHWLDQHLMDTQPYATLALCQDDAHRPGIQTHDAGNTRG